MPMRNPISETMSLEEKARNDLAAARRGVALGTRVAFYGVQSGSAQVKALEAKKRGMTSIAITSRGFAHGVYPEKDDYVHQFNEYYRTVMNEHCRHHTDPFSMASKASGGLRDTCRTLPSAVQRVNDLGLESNAGRGWIPGQGPFTASQARDCEVGDGAGGQ